MKFVTELPGLEPGNEEHVAEVIYQALENAGYDSIGKGTILPQFEALVPYITGEK